MTDSERLAETASETTRALDDGLSILDKCIEVARDIAPSRQTTKHVMTVRGETSHERSLRRYRVMLQARNDIAAVRWALTDDRDIEAAVARLLEIEQAIDAEE